MKKKNSVLQTGLKWKIGLEINLGMGVALAQSFFSDIAHSVQTAEVCKEMECPKLIFPTNYSLEILTTLFY